MRTELLPLLACPVDHQAQLDLVVLEQSQDHIVEGILVCPACGRWFMITDGIAHLVRDGLRLEEQEFEFLARHRDRLPPGLETPREVPSDAI
jgi:uncharacterized protein YbaR (Trm112 family)